MKGGVLGGGGSVGGGKGNLVSVLILAKLQALVYDSLPSFNHCRI